MSWCRYYTSKRATAAWATDARHRHPEYGFSLVEVMIAVVIFSFGLLGFSSMQVMAIRLNTAAYISTQIATVAQEQMETLLTVPFNGTWLDVRVLQDSNPTVGQGTTYCVLYPPEGVRPCQDPSYTPASGYCVVKTQSLAESECSDASFPPPTLGSKVQWSVDIDPPGGTTQIAHVALTASRKTEGKETPKALMLSFARSSL